jgi:hypothetical protein
MSKKNFRTSTTPEEEGIELHPDAWERFERAVDRVVKGGRATQTRKTVAAGRDRRRADRAPAKSTC